MHTQVQPGNFLNYTIPASTTILSGDVVTLTDTIGIAATSGKGDNGDVIALAMTGVHTLAKATGTAYTQGKKLYWDATAKNLTTTASGNAFAGYAAQPAASGDTTAQVLLAR